MNAPVESLRCDVLVIGGGAAALVAALEARKAGCDVLVTSKGNAGRSGNTLVTGAGFAAFVAGGSTGDSLERFRADTLSSGKGVNDPALVDLLVERSGAAIRTLEEYGVRFARSGGDYVRRTPPGHSRPRQIPTVFGAKAYQTRGLSIGLPLSSAAQRAGVRFLERASVLRLLRDDDGVHGAVAVHLAGPTLVTISARAVVLATGGAGMIYERTNNTSDVTGDGYALALDAGATLVDMEFVQFFPAMVFKPVRVTVSTPLFGDGAVMRNRDLERFLARYDPAGDMATRDTMARAAFTEIAMGRGVEGCVYVDCTGIPPDVMKGRYAAFTEYLRSHGVDPLKDLILVAPSTHFFMGGVKVTPDCGSGVDGLFAAGEVVGGVHGANRLSGNALTETVVFGSIAGRSAAAYAGKVPKVSRPATPVSLAKGVRAGDPRELRTVLRRTMWRDVSVVRSGASLARALDLLDGCRRELTTLAAEDMRGDAERAGLGRMLTVAEAVTRSAQLRTESRGSHSRTDFPESDDRWVGNVELRRVGELLQPRFVRGR